MFKLLIFYLFLFVAKARQCYRRYRSLPLVIVAITVDAFRPESSLVESSSLSGSPPLSQLILSHSQTLRPTTNCINSLYKADQANKQGPSFSTPFFFIFLFSFCFFFFYRITLVNAPFNTSFNLLPSFM